MYSLLKELQDSYITQHPVPCWEWSRRQSDNLQEEGRGSLRETSLTDVHPCGLFWCHNALLSDPGILVF